MQKNLYKSANRLRYNAPTHLGILSWQDFQRDYELHCYEPSDDLKPFVVHVWVQRRSTQVLLSRPPLEIQTGPNTYLFMNGDEAYIHGVHSGPFDYDASRAVWVGIKFRPAGFRAFWKGSMSELADATIPANALFADIDHDFLQKLVSMDDGEIIRTCEDLLRKAVPVSNDKARQVDRLMTILSSPDITRVKDCVDAAGLSERTIQTVFRDYVGVSPKWILTRKRLITSLNDTNTTSWTDIAALYGYSNQSHFIKTFKKATGISPSRYRK